MRGEGRLARPAHAARRHLGRGGDQLLALQRALRVGRAGALRPRRAGDRVLRAGRIHRSLLARLRPRRRARLSATASASTASTSRSAASAATRPSCSSTPTRRRSRDRSAGRRQVFGYVLGDRGGGAHELDSAPNMPRRHRHRAGFPWGGPPPEHPLGRHRHLRGPREGDDACAIPTSRRSCAAPTPASATRAVDRAPPAPRRDGGRADAGPPLRRRPAPGREGLTQLLGLQHDRLLRPARALRARRRRRQQVHEFKAMVKALHAAGIEVILDVVYNHTAEGNHLGPTLSLRGHRQRRLLPARRRTTGATTWTSPAAATRSTCGTRACCS